MPETLACRTLSPSDLRPLAFWHARSTCRRRAGFRLPAERDPVPFGPPNPKMLLDFLPIILFFVTYFVANADAEAAARFATEHLGAVVSGGIVAPEVAPVLLATVVVCAATLLQIAVLLASCARRSIPCSGSPSRWSPSWAASTVYFHNPDFIKWKPSAVCWAMALVLLVSQLLGKNLLRTLVGKQLQLPTRSGSGSARPGSCS